MTPSPEALFAVCADAGRGRGNWQLLPVDPVNVVDISGPRSPPAPGRAGHPPATLTRSSLQSPHGEAIAHALERLLVKLARLAKSPGHVF